MNADPAHGINTDRGEHGFSWVTNELRLASIVSSGNELELFRDETMGLLFAACASGRFSIDTLRLPAVVPVALMVSTVTSFVFAPLVLWSLVRTGAKNLCIYGPILWITSAAYIVLLIPRNGIYGFYLCGMLVLNFYGVFILGFIPAAKRSDFSH